METSDDFTERIIKDLAENEILETKEADFTLKPKTKPKRNVSISDEERKRRSEQANKLNEKKRDQGAERKEVILTFKEKELQEKLKVIEEKKKEVKARRKKEEAPVPIAEPKSEPTVVKETKATNKKKPKKAVKVVIETSSDSSDYSSSGDSGSSDESEVIFISKKKKPTKVKEQPITKQKHEPPTEAPKPFPAMVFKFV